MHADMHRNHVRPSPEDAANGRVAVLAEGTYGLARIHNLEGVQRRSHRGHHIRRGHGQRYRPRLQNRVSAGQQLLRVNVGHRAGGRNLQVAAHQLSAHRRAWQQARNRLGRGRRVHIGCRAHPSGSDHLQAGSCHLLLPKTNRLGTESAHHQRRFHRLHIFLVRRMLSLFPSP